MTSEPASFDVDACIIDLDGTLVDTLGDFEAALNLMLAEMERPPIDAQAIRRLVGKGSEHLIGSVLALTADVPQAEAPDASLMQRAWPIYQRHYLALNGRQARVYDGVLEGLARFRAQGLRLACLTNKPGQFARPLLRTMGLEAYFDHSFGGDAFASKKPDPMPVLMACRALGSAPERTLVIGDSCNDARAARAAGCPVVLVDYGYNHGQDVHQVDCDAVVARIDDIGLARTKGPTSIQTSIQTSIRP